MTARNEPTLAVITCRVLEQEVARFAQSRSHIVLIETLPEGLYSDPHRLHVELQRTIGRIESEHPEIYAIALAQGMCCRGSDGITPKRCVVAAPRVQDCMALLYGPNSTDSVARDDREIDLNEQEQSRQCGEQLKIAGDQRRLSCGILESLLACQWDEERFVVIPPGQRLTMVGDERIIATG